MRIEDTCYNDYITGVPKGIQVEINQSKPFSSPEAEAYLALLRTAEVFQERAAKLLKPHHLSPTQYNALRILRGAGEAGLACREIAERMLSRDPDITRLLDRMERRGLIARSRDNRDRRIITARITSTGLDLLKGLDRIMDEFPRRLLGHLGASRLQLLIRCLDLVREGRSSGHSLNRPS
jgi:DNA-binding MarR family transcriptional regulator